MKNLSYSQIKEIRDIFGAGSWREIVENITRENNDFSIDSTDEGDVRFILSDDIDEIQREEMANDEYSLGCFNADFIAECSGWPVELIEAAQKGEAYEALGKALIKSGHVEGMQQSYASADGYGHHFACYDFETHELRVLDGKGNKEDFFWFRVN